MKILGTLEKYSPYNHKIMNSNHATVIDGQESKKAKLLFLTLVNQSNTGQYGASVSFCLWKRAVNTFHRVCHAALWYMLCGFMILVGSCCVIGEKSLVVGTGKWQNWEYIGFFFFNRKRPSRLMFFFLQGFPGDIGPPGQNGPEGPKVCYLFLSQTFPNTTVSSYLVYY